MLLRGLVARESGDESNHFRDAVPHGSGDAIHAVLELTEVVLVGEVLSDNLVVRGSFVHPAELVLRPRGCMVAIHQLLVAIIKRGFE